MSGRARSLVALVAAAACGLACETPPDLAPAIELEARPAFVVQRPTRIQESRATSSLAFSDLPDSIGGERDDHEPLRVPKPHTHRRQAAANDPGVQSSPVVLSMPVASHNFHGQGFSTTTCSGSCGTPPDTNGVVGPNHYVQTVNAGGTQGLAIWSKTGTLLSGPKDVNTLFSTFASTDPCRTRNDGDPVVVYDQLADRWFITQFALPNSSTAGGPSYQCIAVSKTGDPTGAYWLYEFSYPYAVNDYGKFGIWNDAYYAEFNQFNSTYQGAEFVAYDRSKMLVGAAATQHVWFQAYGGTGTFLVFSALPVSLEGKIAPPNGEPGYFMQFDQSGNAPYNALDLWSVHVDFTTPGNSTLTGPTVLTVNSFTPSCYNAFISPSPVANCIPQPGTTTTVDGLDDRLMFRFSYRNFGTYESIVVNHSVEGGNGGTSSTCSGCAGSGLRWYEIQMQPGGASPTIVQQGTYAPADANWRWMGSMAQDQAKGMALGFAISSGGSGGTAVAKPSIAWTGRINTDAAGTMGQGESVIDNGSFVEGNVYGGNAKRGRWGDYSNMTVDPTDDCTFWYTQELYDISGSFSWDTWISSTKFPNCAANDFTITVTDPSGGEGLVRGSSAVYNVATTSSAGSAEMITLKIQNLPSGVSAVFSPTTVTAGSSATLTLSATGSATTGASTFTVIGTATSAVHAAKGNTVVITTAPGSCTLGNQGVWCWDTPLGGFTYGPLGMDSEGYAFEVAMVGAQVSKYDFTTGANKYYGNTPSTTTASTRVIPVQFSKRNGANNTSDALFFGTSDGFVYRIDAVTGACQWRASIARGSGVGVDYQVDNGCLNNFIPNPCGDSVQLDPIGTYTGDDHTSLIIVGTRNGALSCGSATVGNRVYAFRADDGTFVWKYDPEPGIKLGAITSLYPDIYADGCSTQRNQIIVGSLAPTGGGTGALVTISAATGAQIAVDSASGFATAVTSQNNLAFNDGPRCGHLYSAGTSSVYLGTVTAAGSCTTPPCELATFGSGSHSYSNVSVSRAHHGQIVVRQDGNILLLRDTGTALALDCSYTPPAANGNAAGDPGSLGDNFYFATTKGSVIELPFDNGAGSQTTNGGACIGAKIRQFSAAPSTTAVANPGFDFNSTFTQSYLIVGDQAGRIESFTIPLVSPN